MNTEQYINQQVGQKLLIYNHDLSKKNGNHYLEYFSWATMICGWAFVGIQIIRYFISE
jgi:hypothetical protein